MIFERTRTLTYSFYTPYPISFRMAVMFRSLDASYMMVGFHKWGAPKETQIYYGPYYRDYQKWGPEFFETANVGQACTTPRQVPFSVVFCWADPQERPINDPTKAGTNNFYQALRSKGL